MRLWPRKKVYLDNLPQTHDLRFAAVFFVILVVVLGSVYAVGYVVAGDRVPRGTTVADIEIGNLSRKEAQAELRTGLAPRLQEPITITGGPDDVELDLRDAGVRFDLAATVDDAMSGESWDPRHMFASLIGGDEVDPVVVFDDTKLGRALDPLMRATRVAPVDSTVTFRAGDPQVVNGSAGETVDLPGLEAAIAEALRDEMRSVRLPTVAVPPEVTSREAETFLASVARPAVSAPVRLRTKASAVVVPVEQFAAALSAQPSQGELRLGIDPPTAYRLGTLSRESLPGDPIDARLMRRGDRVVVLPGRPGLRPTPEAWSEAVLAAAQRPDGRRTAELALVASPPALTTEEAVAMQVRRRISTYTLRFPASVELAEIRRAARAIDGVLIRPGGALSYLSRVRPIGPAGPAAVVATATFNVSLLAGLDVVERYSDPTRPDYLPEGREAVVRRPRVDLLVENRLPYGVLLDTRVDRTSAGGVVSIEAWSSRYWKVGLRTSSRQDVTQPEPIRRTGSSCRREFGSPGYTVELTRIRQREALRREDSFISRYAAVRGVICGLPGGAQQPQQ